MDHLRYYPWNSHASLKRAWIQSAKRIGALRLGKYDMLAHGLIILASSLIAFYLHQMGRAFIFSPELNIARVWIPLFFTVFVMTLVTSVSCALILTISTAFKRRICSLRVQLNQCQNCCYPVSSRTCSECGLTNDRSAEEPESCVSSTVVLTFLVFIAMLVSVGMSELWAIQRDRVVVKEAKTFFTNFPDQKIYARNRLWPLEDFRVVYSSDGSVKIYD